MDLSGIDISIFTEIYQSVILVIILSTVSNILIIIKLFDIIRTLKKIQESLQKKES